MQLKIFPLYFSKNILLTWKIFQWCELRVGQLGHGERERGEVRESHALCHALRHALCRGLARVEQHGEEAGRGGRTRPQTRPRHQAQAPQTKEGYLQAEQRTRHRQRWDIIPIIPMQGWVFSYHKKLHKKLTIFALFTSDRISSFCIVIK